MQTARCPHCHRERIVVVVRGAPQFRTHTASDHLNSAQCKGSRQPIVSMLLLRPLALRQDTKGRRRRRTMGKG